MLAANNNRRAKVMKTVRIKVYSFNELSEEAKIKAVNKLADINVDFEWWVYSYEDAERIGLKITSFGLDRNRHCEGEFILSANEVAQNIINEHGENCKTYKEAVKFLELWNPVFADYMDETSPNFETYGLENQMLDLEDDFLESILNCYAKMLQDESDYLQSREAIEETILANDYQFLVDGTMFKKGLQ